ncbi:hypothetical protein Bbelb_375970 [Branchiostoma belcheri]|nr:hypothetical protein Bbelb_375970 [Branchiostoma belcheri]
MKATNYTPHHWRQIPAGKTGDSSGGQEFSFCRCRFPRVPAIDVMMTSARARCMGDVTRVTDNERRAAAKKGLVEASEIGYGEMSGLFRLVMVAPRTSSNASSCRAGFQAKETAGVDKSASGITAGSQRDHSGITAGSQRDHSGITAGSPDQPRRDYPGSHPYMREGRTRAEEAVATTNPARQGCKCFRLGSGPAGRGVSFGKR